MNTRNEASVAAPAARPRWLVLAPFLGRPPELTARQWQVLGLVSVATLFDQYDRALFSLALPQIQAGLGIAEGDVGFLGGLVRMGALPALFAGLAADRLGRRRVLLFTILAYTVLTGATAFAPDARSFVTLQFLARIFTTAEVILAIVVVAEEFGAEKRGWGIGALFAIQACGVGLAAALFPVMEALGFGWRGLYAVGLVPLLLIARWRRGLPETERFEHHRRSRESSGEREWALAPIIHLARDYPGRFAMVSSVILIGAVGGAAGDFLGPKYLQDAHGWSPSGVALLFVGGGAFGIVGAALSGGMSDRVGRRRVAIVLGLALTVLSVSFYNAPGWALAPVWVVMVFSLMGSDAVLSAFATELFPTSHRSTASGARAVVGTLGASIGLALESLLYGVFGSHWIAVSLLLCATLAIPLIVWLAFPETAGRSLEEISPER